MLSGLSLVVTAGLAQTQVAVLAGEAAGYPAALAAEPFPLSQVRLLDGPFRDAMVRDEIYLLSLDCDRLLYSFRVNAKLPTQARPYGGWEAPSGELRGHSVGHYLSACSLMYASTGDARFKERADKIVAGFAECQAALGSNATHFGFLSACPESFIDRVETGRQVWAPWYTLHKIMAGLLDANQLCGNAQALEVLTNMANWVKFRVDRLSEEQMQASLRDRVWRHERSAREPLWRHRQRRLPEGRRGVQPKEPFRSAGRRRGPPERTPRQHADSQDDRRGAAI